MSAGVCVEWINNATLHDPSTVVEEVGRLCAKVRLSGCGLFEFISLACVMVVWALCFVTCYLFIAPVRSAIRFEWLE